MIEPPVKNLTIGARMGCLHAFKARGSNGAFMNFQGFRIECDVRKDFLGGDPVISMSSTGNGLIYVDPLQPETIVMALGVDQTDIPPGEYYYDVIAVPAQGQLMFRGFCGGRRDRNC